MSHEFKTIELKVIPSTKRQEFKLLKFFKVATRLWKYIVDNGITDTSKIKGMSTKYLAAQFIQGMVREFRANLKSQRELKKLGKSGKIIARFKYTVTHFSGQLVSIIDSKHIKIRKLGTFYVRGLRQLDKYDSYKIVTVKLLKQATGYYVHLTIKIKKQESSQPKKFLGLDFGIKDAIVTSNGYSINWLAHKKLDKINRRIVRLQRLLARKIKGSNNFGKTVFLLRKTYEKASFVKREIKNKIVSVFRNYYLVFQDELIKQWHSSGFKGIRRRVQNLGLGELKAKLKKLEFIQILDSSIATTKTCLKCLQKNDISLSDRIYKCSSCGYTMPRDLHSALNMLRFFGFSYQECMQDSRIQFEFDSHEIAKLQTTGITIQKI